MDEPEFVCGKEFFFRQRRGKLDLRKLSQLDLESVIKNVDIDILQNYLENVVFSNLTEDDFRFMTDPLVVKLFKISQLMIEYLLFAQEQLAANLKPLLGKLNDFFFSSKRNKGGGHGFVVLEFFHLRTRLLFDEFLH